MSEPADHLRRRRRNGVALLRLDRPESRNAINTAMLEELLAHLEAARADEDLRVLVLSSTDHMGFSAGADVREDLDRDGRDPPDAALRRPLRRADRLPAPDDRRLPRRLRRRRRRDRRLLRPARRRLEHAPALPRRRPRRPGRPGPAGHALRALGRQVPAAHLEGDRRRRGVPLGPRPQGRAGAADRGGRRSSSPRRSPSTRPSRSAGSSRCCTPGTGSRTAPARRARARSSGSPRARAWATGPSRPQCRSAPLLEIAHGDDAFAALAAEVGGRRAGRRARGAGLGRPAARTCSPRSPRPSPASAGGRCSASPPTTAAPATSRPSSAPTWRPRRVRYYPSRGTGYESHLAPPPHLVGLRIAALDALVGEPAEGEPPVVVASAVALAEAVPDASLRPGRLRARRRARRSTSATSPSCSPAAATSGSSRSTTAASSPSAAASSTSSARPRTRRPGSSCSATRSSRSATSRPSPSARSAEADRIELDPAAEIDPDHRILAEEALADADEDGPERPLAELLPTDRFGSLPRPDRRRAPRS